MHVCCVSRFCWRMWIYIYTYTPVFTHLWWKANRTFYKCSTCSTITHTFLRNYCYKSTQTQCLVLFVHIFVFSQSAVHYEARNVARFHNTGQKFCNLSQKSHVTKLGLLVMHSQGCREKRGKGQQSRMTASLFLVSCLFFPFFFCATSSGSAHMCYYIRSIMGSNKCSVCVTNIKATLMIPQFQNGYVYTTVNARFSSLL